MLTTNTICVIDYCSGNLKSVTRALDFLKLPNKVTNDPAEIEKATAVVVPGVGAAGSAMNELKLKKMDEALKEYLIADRPFLGICLGLQILFEQSEENQADCLGVFAGEVQKLTGAVKIPHIGWNEVERIKDKGQRTKSDESRNSNDQPELLKDIPDGTYFYNIHSYYSVPTDKSLIVAETTHGVTFPAVLNRGNIWATQFHPEKSGTAGLKVFQNFAKLAGF